MGCYPRPDRASLSDSADRLGNRLDCPHLGSSASQIPQYRSVVDRWSHCLELCLTFAFSLRNLPCIFYRTRQLAEPRGSSDDFGDRRCWGRAVLALRKNPARRVGAILARKHILDTSTVDSSCIGCRIRTRVAQPYWTARVPTVLVRDHREILTTDKVRLCGVCKTSPRLISLIRYTPSDATLLVKQRIIGLMGLVALLWLFVPYQFAFVIIFMMHFSTAAASHPDAVRVSSSDNCYSS